MADLMVIGTEGSVRTSNWTFHDRDRDEPQTASLELPVRADRASILAAIRATSDRHTGNRALTAVGLTPAAWHILFRAMIEAESAYDPTATSPKGAYGLGQLMSATARALGVDRNDPAQNLEGAARYLLAQLSTFRDIDLALAAYNAGPDRVRDYNGVPPFAETHRYITRIHNIRRRLSGQPFGQPVIRLSTRAESRVPVVINLN
ncbi:lytic transglycosylase domain-containing protein [Aliiroseovarius sp. S2029]|uniref:lytic transglycosylase domain-containing protein n=1 Tax=Aliiroseovarius sp. S2029 TaxID=2936988 RepID=UPI0020BE3B87|nr:lytic transglycosylase domain-containing protein [Aliiroseovarius sp. S2029]MCK8485310.1 lytic transglycosylase domain-containing protein [Aliiroseovarius sp. S2029]